MQWSVTAQQLSISRFSGTSLTHRILDILSRWIHIRLHFWPQPKISHSKSQLWTNTIDFKKSVFILYRGDILLSHKSNTKHMYACSLSECLMISKKPQVGMAGIKKTSSILSLLTIHAACHIVWHSHSLFFRIFMCALVQLCYFRIKRSNANEYSCKYTNTHITHTHPRIQSRNRSLSLTGAERRKGTSHNGQTNLARSHLTSSSSSPVRI